MKHYLHVYGVLFIILLAFFIEQLDYARIRIILGRDWTTGQLSPAVQVHWSDPASGQGG